MIFEFDEPIPHDKYNLDDWFGDYYDLSDMLEVMLEINEEFLRDEIKRKNGIEISEDEKCVYGSDDRHCINPRTFSFKVIESKKSNNWKHETVLSCSYFTITGELTELDDRIDEIGEAIEFLEKIPHNKKRFQDCQKIYVNDWENILKIELILYGD